MLSPIEIGVLKDLFPSPIHELVMPSDLNIKRYENIQINHFNKHSIW